MTDYEIPTPEPKEIDEKNWLELKDVMERATLRGHPYGEDEKTERCDNCLYYLNPDDEISYCWHQTLRILVGGDWWCQWWEAIPEDS
jgi:hypothetical protein